MNEECRIRIPFIIYISENSKIHDLNTMFESFKNDDFHKFILKNDLKNIKIANYNFLPKDNII